MLPRGENQVFDQLFKLLLISYSHDQMKRPEIHLIYVLLSVNSPRLEVVIRNSYSIGWI